LSIVTRGPKVLNMSLAGLREGDEKFMMHPKMIPIAYHS